MKNGLIMSSRYLVDLLDKCSPSVSKSIGSKKVWTAFKGRQQFYGTHDVTSPGYTIHLHRPFSTTEVFLLDKEEIIDTLDNHEQNFGKYCEIDEKIGQYLSSEKGKWGRQD